MLYLWPIRDVAQSGRASALGAECRQFESGYPDKKESIPIGSFFVLKYFIKSLAVKAESFYIPKHETDKEPFTNSR